MSRFQLTHYTPINCVERLAIRSTSSLGTVCQLLTAVGCLVFFLVRPAGLTKHSKSASFSLIEGHGRTSVRHWEP